MGQSNPTVVAYKQRANEMDPAYSSDPFRTTCLWRDVPANRPEAALVGVQYDYNTIDLDIHR